MSFIEKRIDNIKRLISIVREDSFRSSTKVNTAPDQVCVTITMPVWAWRVLKEILLE